MNRTVKNIIPLFLLLFTFACTKKPAQQQEESAVPVVRLEKVSRVAFRDEIYATGRVTYKDEFQLSFKTSGIVGNIPVKEGQRINAGQLMASLKLEEIRAKVGQAENGLDKARRDYERVKGLYGDSVATLEHLQNARTQLENARLEVETAQFNLKHSQIRAPGNGWVLKVNTRENEAVQAGMPVIFFGRGSVSMIITTNLSDADVVKIAIGDTAWIRFDPFPDKLFNGAITEIAGTADPVTGTYEIKINMNDSENQLKSGFIGNISIRPSVRKERVQIPVDALIFADANEGSIYVAKDDTAYQRHIRIEKIAGDSLLVSEGLEGHETIVVEGLQKLSGDSVRISLK
jgi:RND family efflux transporter MFP subunit